MAALYVLYFEDQSGDTILCDDYENEQDVIKDMHQLSVEFPEFNYYYEIVDDGQ